MIGYFVKHYDMLMGAFDEHLVLVGVILLLSIAIAAVLSYVLIPHQRATERVLQVFGAIYSIPSLALFALLIPVFGLGNKTAIPVLVTYNQYLLLRNFLTGLTQVEPGIIEAAVGMGMSRWQVTWRVRVPLALPAIISGIRLSIVSTTGIATIAAAIHAGGLGTVLFSGLRTMNTYKLAWGTILCMVIALSADIILRLLERREKRVYEGDQDI